jgi:5'-nucleotidase
MKNPKILITNDDGIESPGLELLERVAANFSDDVWVVAPQTERSGTAHSITLTSTIRTKPAGERRVAVDGTPTDCVVIAVDHVLDGPPDLVLSGVNKGPNAAEDILSSGTCAAAMEAAARGIPALSLSQDLHFPGPLHWDTAEHYAGPLIGYAIEHGMPEAVYWVVNFPAVAADEVKGIEVTVQSHRSPYSWTSVESRDPRGAVHYWLHRERAAIELTEEGTDLGALERGLISLAPLTLRMTAGEHRQEIQEDVGALFETASRA